MVLNQEEDLIREIIGIPRESNAVEESSPANDDNNVTDEEGWTLHKGYDLCNKGDVESSQISNFIDLKEIKAVAKEKGYSGFTLCDQIVYFKKLDYVITKEHLDESDCELWSYDPSKDKKANKETVALGKKDALKNFIRNTPFAKTDITDLRAAIQKL